MKSLCFLFGLAFFLDEFTISEPLPSNFSFDKTNNREHVNRSQSVHSRIINAKEEIVTNRKYPWLARVYRKKYLKKKIKDEENEIEWTDDGGVIVTNTMILTCGRCVCDEPYDFENKKFINVDKWIQDGKPNHFCLQDIDNVGSRNQNRKGENEVYYSIGIQRLLEEKSRRSVVKFDDKIVVVVPNYVRITKKDHPNWTGRLSKNGDIAVIMKNAGFDLEKWKASIIHLPNPDYKLEGRNIDANLFVRTASRGNRYYDDTEKGGASEPLHACYTNGAARHENRNVKHARCLEYSRGENDPSFIDGCPYILNVKDSFSVDSDVKIAGDAYVNLEGNDNECQTLYNEAIKVVNRKIREHPESADLLDRFNTKAERFLVYKYEKVPVPNGQKFPPGYYSRIHCYIKNKVAKYGVCKTKQEPKWGFCSKSCRVTSNDDLRKQDGGGYTPYEEVDGYYYEDIKKTYSGIVQTDRGFIALPWAPEAYDEINEIFKCVVPKLDGAETARFIKVGPETERDSLSFVDFEKDDDPINTGYSELDQGDQGSPWWKRKQDTKLDDASERVVRSPVLVAIHHKSKRWQGPTEDLQEYCRQYATKISKEIVNYILKECEKNELCTDVCVESSDYYQREEQTKNKRCGGREEWMWVSEI